jgi:hypothetical protein
MADSSTLHDTGLAPLAFSVERGQEVASGCKIGCRLVMSLRLLPFVSYGGTDGGPELPPAGHQDVPIKDLSGYGAVPGRKMEGSQETNTRALRPPVVPPVA